MAKKWYVVHTYSGHEKKVQESIKRAIASEGLEDKFGEILIPIEEIVEMKDGKKRVSKRKYYPSYVLVEMELTKETQYLVSNVMGVTNFVGIHKEGRYEPIPLKEDEVNRILAQVKKGKEEAVEVPYTVGDSVIVIDGPFKEFTGKVEEVNMERKKLKVMVSIFGRATPVEFDFLQVKLIT